MYGAIGPKFIHFHIDEYRKIVLILRILMAVIPLFTFVDALLFLLTKLKRPYEFVEPCLVVCRWQLYCLQFVVYKQ